MSDDYIRLRYGGGVISDEGLFGERTEFVDPADYFGDLGYGAAYEPPPPIPKVIVSVLT